MNDDVKLQVLNILCGVLQIVGLLLIVLQGFLPEIAPAFVPVLIGISGFAAVVKYFIPVAEGIEKHIRPTGALAGIVIIIFSVIQA